MDTAPLPSAVASASSVAEGGGVASTPSAESMTPSPGQTKERGHHDVEGQRVGKNGCDKH